MKVSKTKIELYSNDPTLTTNDLNLETVVYNAQKGRSKDKKQIQEKTSHSGEWVVGGGQVSTLKTGE